MKYFKFDWSATEYLSDQQNLKQIAAVIVPTGYEGKRIQKQMLYTMNGIDKDEDVIILNDDDEKVTMSIHEDDDDDDAEVISQHNESMLDMMKNGEIPMFFQWNDDIERLLREFKEKNVIKEDRKKVVSHKSAMVYDYNEWNDISCPYPGFEAHGITKLNISKAYVFVNDETKNDYNEQKERFLSTNDKDECQSFNEEIEIRGYKKCLNIRKHDSVSGSIESTPFWGTWWGYWICSVLLCTLYPRYKCATMYGHYDWKIIKSISI